MADIAINYDYKAAPTLARFALSNAIIRGLQGPFGSGKSSACAVEILRRGMETPRCKDGIRRSRWAVIRNTYGELRDTTIKTVFQWMPPERFGKYVEQKHTFTITAIPKCNIEVIFMALDRPDDVRKLLSLELTGAWVNEAREIPWGVIEALEGRTGRFPQVNDCGPYWRGVWMDTNPPDSDSAWYRFFEERKWLDSFYRLRAEGALPRDMAPEDYACIFHQPSGLAHSAENLKYLRPGYYQQLAIGKSEEWVKVYVRGEYGFVIEGRAVYPEYSDNLHCKEFEPVPNLPIIRAFDFGLTPACVFAQILPDGRFGVFDEMTSENMGIDRFSDDVLDHCARSFRGGAKFEDWGDPAGQQRVQTDEKTCFDILHAKGIFIQAAQQDLTLRLESVRKLLRTLEAGQPQFVLHPRCKALRKGFMGGYRYRRLAVSGAERYTDEPEKNKASHPHDALQYGVVPYFGAGLLTGPPTDDDLFEDLGDRLMLGGLTGRSTYTGY